MCAEPPPLRSAETWLHTNRKLQLLHQAWRWHDCGWISSAAMFTDWFRNNNLHLNVEKTKEIIVDLRGVHTQHAPLSINGDAVKTVSSSNFLGVYFTEDLTWTYNSASLARKAQQRLDFLCTLRAGATNSIMIPFYRGTKESILTSCITVLYGDCTASCCKTLQHVVRSAEKVFGFPLLSLLDSCNTRLTCKAIRIAGDPTHPSHSLFSLLLSRRRWQSLWPRTIRLKDSFIHQAVRKPNSLFCPQLLPPAHNDSDQPSHCIPSIIHTWTL